MQSTMSFRAAMMRRREVAVLALLFERVEEAAQNTRDRRSALVAVHRCAVGAEVRGHVRRTRCCILCSHTWLLGRPSAQ